MPEPIDNEAMVKEVVEQLTPAITEKVYAQIMDKMPDRSKVTSQEDKSLEEKQAIASCFKDLEAGKVKALTTGGSTSGAEFVPTYVSSEIERVAANNGLVDKYARKYPMQGTKENVPTATSVTAYRVNEGAKITSSQPTTGNLALTSKTVGVLIPVSRKLLRNATPATVDLMLALAGEAFAKIKDQWALLGLTSGEGVFQHASVTGVTMASTMTTYAKATPEDLLSAIDVIDENVASDKLRWVMSRSLLNIFREKRAAVGSDAQGFLFQGFGAGTPPTLWDIPYSLSPIMPRRVDGSQAGKKFIALMDFNRVILGQEEAMTMEMSDQATITDTDGSTLINMFEQNMVALKFSADIDLQLSTPASSFAWVKTAAS